MCFFFHKWDKWEQYEANMTIIPGILSPKNIQGIPIDIKSPRQKRYCIKCNKVQDEEIEL